MRTAEDKDLRLTAEAMLVALGRSLGIAHHLLRPRHPQSNGKVERFFRTVDDECLALQKRWTFAHRTRAVDAFVWFYNHERPHLGLNGMTPVARRDSYFSSLQLSLMS